MSARASSPVRTCVGCGARDAQTTMVRLQLDEGGALLPVARAGAGRSAYVHATPGCATAILKTRLLRRSLRHDVDRTKREGLVERLAAMPPGRACGSDEASLEREVQG